MAKLLEGGIAKLVARELVKAGLSKPVVITKSTVGTRMPGAAAGGTNPITTSYRAKGIEASRTALAAAGTLLTGVDAAIRIYAATIVGGVTPVPGDRVSIGRKTYTIVEGGVDTDAATATHLCQCRL